MDAFNFNEKFFFDYLKKQPSRSLKIECVSKPIRLSEEETNKLKVCNGCKP